MKKKLIMILCASTMLTAMPLTAGAAEVEMEVMDAAAQESAESETAEGLTVPELSDWEYYFKDESQKTVTLGKYRGNDVRIKVPATYGSYKVICFNETFSHNTTVKEVAFEKGVTFFDDWISFFECSSLEKASIPDGVTYCSFSGCSSLTEAPDIPESVTSCREMFSGCSSLTEAPDIPDGVTNCGLMFSGCSSLVEAPDIPDGVTNCEDMFFGCSSLTEAPDIPDGVTYCGAMFFGCSSLVEASDIPDGVTYCTNMFKGCSSLVEAPDIPDGVAECSGMFEGCSSLVEAPDIPEGVTRCNSMFKGCSSLVEAPDISEGVYNCESMFKGCSSLKKAPDIPEGVLYCTDMFSGCSSLKKAPDIPEGVLYCNAMFEGCSSLEKAPDIPEGVHNCYSMFKDCSKLAGEMTINGAIDYDYGVCSCMFSGAATEGPGLTIYYADGVNIDEILATKSPNSKITAKPLSEKPTPDNPTPTPDTPTPASGSITSAGIYVDRQDNNGVLAGLVTESTSDVDKEYRWLCYDIEADTWSVYSDWTLNNEWVQFNPGKAGDYLLQGEVRCAGMTEAEKTNCIGVNHHPNIKGKCQMPYTGEGGGYLIGLESYDNADYQYEMLILDCTLLAEGKDAWTYTTGKCKVDGNGFWTIWQPQYGYYWTLFRVYDKDGNLIDQDCYGFENI